MSVVARPRICRRTYLEARARYELVSNLLVKRALTSSVTLQLDVLNVFDQLSAAGRTIVIITHEPEVGARAKRLIRLVDGVYTRDPVTR